MLDFLGERAGARERDDLVAGLESVVAHVEFPHPGTARHAPKQPDTAHPQMRCSWLTQEAQEGP